MTVLFAPDCVCRVFTFKQGLLSALAHDLEIEVGKLSIAIDAERIEGRFDASSLHVLWAMHDHKPDYETLTESNKADIDASIAKEVLHAAKHPEIVFIAPRPKVFAPGTTLRGKLRLLGVERNVDVVLAEHDGRYVAKAVIDQRDFDIRQFSAMLGTLKIRNEVHVEVSMPRQP